MISAGSTSEPQEEHGLEKECVQPVGEGVNSEHHSAEVLRLPGIHPGLIPQASTSVESLLPKKGPLLGIDFGTVRVGVSICDRSQKFASPLHNYQRQAVQADERFFRKLVAEYEVVGLVVGLPLHLSGDESPKSAEARRYAVWLSKVTSLPHDFQDERFTSSYAEQLMIDADLTSKQRKQRIDKLAAQILLQCFLDRRLSNPDG